MLKVKLFTFYVFFKHLICPCGADKRENDFSGGIRYKISKVGKMPVEVEESSGLVVANKKEKSLSFYTHNDSGGKPELYEINQEGNLLSVKELSNIKNKDWEDLASDNLGNIFIGDFGNNLNQRKDLVIYKVNLSADTIGKIYFHYPDQENFPPVKEEKNFDCEAFFWYADSLYLFSKNRGNKQVKLYKVPAIPGRYTAELVDSTRLKAMVTAADINPTEDFFALLAYGKIYMFRVKNGVMNFQSPLLCRRFSRSGQAESLVFVNDTDFLMSNENGKIFFARKKKKQSGG